MESELLLFLRGKKNVSQGISFLTAKNHSNQSSSFPSSPIHAYLLFDGVQNVSNKNSSGLSKNFLALITKTLIKCFYSFHVPCVIALALHHCYMENKHYSLEELLEHSTTIFYDRILHNYHGNSHEPLPCSFVLRAELF